MATSVMWCGVVERRLPTRGCGTIGPPPFHFGTRCHILAASVTHIPSLSRPDERQGPVDHETETDTQLVTETLVEEVSIDGMCGVY
jgi:mycofactocin precursor peptide MftA